MERKGCWPRNEADSFGWFIIFELAFKTINCFSGPERKKTLKATLRLSGRPLQVRRCPVSHRGAVCSGLAEGRLNKGNGLVATSGWRHNAIREITAHLFRPRRGHVINGLSKMDKEVVHAQ